MVIKKNFVWRYSDDQKWNVDDHDNHNDDDDDYNDEQRSRQRRRDDDDDDDDDNDYDNNADEEDRDPTNRVVEIVDHIISIKIGAKRARMDLWFLTCVHNVLGSCP